MGRGIAMKLYQSSPVFLLELKKKFFASFWVVVSLLVINGNKGGGWL